MTHFDRGLVERLEAASVASSASRAPFDKSVLIESVLNNVRRILNERRGSCETRADYGLPDMNDVLGRGGTPARMTNIVQETIELFEPRLSSVVVRFFPDLDHPLRVNFHISATLRYGDVKERIAFDTVLSEDKRMHVRG